MSFYFLVLEQQMSVSPEHPTNSSARLLKACFLDPPQDQSHLALMYTAFLSALNDLREPLKDGNALPMEWDFSSHTLLLPDQCFLPSSLSRACSHLPSLCNIQQSLFLPSISCLCHHRSTSPWYSIISITHTHTHEHAHTHMSMHTHT